MTQELNKIQKEFSGTETWLEEMALRQRYENAAYDRDKERLLHCELARLRLKLLLAKEIKKSEAL